MLTGLHMAVVSLDGSGHLPALPRCRSMPVTWLRDRRLVVRTGSRGRVAAARSHPDSPEWFHVLTRGDWGHGPAADLHAVLDHAIAEGWVEADRIGIAGNSYGGYMSAWMVGTSPRFRAAVIENPVTDLVSMYYTSDIGTTFFPPSFGGAPHEVLDTYRDQSPILRAHLCRTPCLFLVGEQDRRCPSPQAWAMHRVLRLNGVPSEVMVLPDCSHEGTTFGPPVARRAADAALVDWFTRWL